MDQAVEPKPGAGIEVNLPSGPTPLEKRSYSLWRRTMRICSRGSTLWIVIA